jgi:hypothetical protein
MSSMYDDIPGDNSDISRLFFLEEGHQKHCEEDKKAADKNGYSQNYLRPRPGAEFQFAVLSSPHLTLCRIDQYHSKLIHLAKQSCSMQ